MGGPEGCPYASDGPVACVNNSRGYHNYEIKSRSMIEFRAHTVNHGKGSSLDLN